MSEKATRKFQKELNSGAVSLVVLSVLRQLGRPAYGYEIARLLQVRAGDSLPMNQAAIYPVLRSLERQSLLESHTRPSDAGPPRKYYQLTTSGDEALRAWTNSWDVTTQFVNSILGGMTDDDSRGGANDDTSARSGGSIPETT